MREGQCKARHGSSCAIINEELGWKHLTPLKDCDRCLAAGGPQGGEGIRAELVQVFVSVVKKYPAKANKEMLEGLKKWTTPEELEKILSNPEVVWARERSAAWQEVRPSWEKAESAIRSMLSRGITGKRVELTIKNTRHISCFGTTLEGAQVAPFCPSLAKSKDGTHYYCNACGCGDTEIALLDGEGYSKLDYPYLECPRKRAGFSNSELPLVPLSPKKEEEVVFGCQGGIGDLVLHCWHAEGYKKKGIPCAFSCGDSKRIELLRLLGQRVVANGRGTIVTGGEAEHYMYELRVDKGSNPRAEVWASQLPHNPEVIQPQVNILGEIQERIKKSLVPVREGKKLVVLFPFAEWAPRMWPLNYWLDLSWLLVQKGFGVVCLAPSSKESAIKGFPHFRWGQGWIDVAATIKEADIVIGNDSGPAHLAGTLGVKTIAIMGPTKKVFAHCPSVEEVSFTPMPCTGCHFQRDQGFRAACDVGCRSLMSLTPELVADMVAVSIGEKNV